MVSATTSAAATSEKASLDTVSAMFKGPNTSVNVKLEVADNRLERKRGLMFRSDLPQKSGMIFVFPEEDN